jgi:hypothetical protein
MVIPGDWGTAKMTEFRKQNSEFRNDHGQPPLASPQVFAEF